MLHDLRLAIRTLSRSPGFTAVSVLTLTLGIGANTAIFSVVDGVLLRPTPLAEPHALVMVWETDRNTGTTREPASVPDFLDYRERARSLADLAALMADEVNLTPPTGEPARLAALRATHRLLPMLGVRPIGGRTFTSAEDQPGGPRVALISESLANRLFQGTRAAIGRTLPLDDLSHTVVGVLPDSADFGVLQVLASAAYSRAFADRGDRTRVDVWTPLQADPESFPRSTHPILMVGRLGQGQGAAAAQQELAGLAAELERAYPVNANRGVFVEPLARVVFGPSRPALLLLVATVALVLIVACVNVANLMLARGTARAREVAVRAALGGSRTRLARQFTAESVLLTAVAAGAGVALAHVGLRVLLAMAPADVPRLESVGLDRRVFGVTLCGSLVVAVVFGLVPLLQAGRLDVAGALQVSNGSRSGHGAGASRIRALLVVVEVCMAALLAAGAGLLIRSFWNVQQIDPGFRSTGVLKAEYQLPFSRYPVDFRVWPNFKEIHAFNEKLLERASALPGVEVAAVAGNHPLDPGFTNSFSVVGREAEAARWPEISVRRVSPSYLAAVGLSLLAGRRLSDSDGTSSAPVVLINQAAARRFFAGRDPIGAQVRFWGAERRVVGVVGNERFQGVTQAHPIAVYVPLKQAPSANGAGVLLVRTAGDPETVASAVRGVVRDIDPALAVFGVEPLSATVSRSVSQRRFTMLLLALFAGVALTLAAIGVHGLISYNLTRRTREIGVRLALGARPHRVFALVMSEGLTLVGLGLALGLAGSLALSRLLSSLLFDVSTTDPATFIAVAGALSVVALVALYRPARRATRIDPAAALRME